MFSPRPSLATPLWPSTSVSYTRCILRIMLPRRCRQATQPRSGRPLKSSCTTTSVSAVYGVSLRLWARPQEPGVKLPNARCERWLAPKASGQVKIRMVWPVAFGTPSVGRWSPPSPASWSAPGLAAELSRSSPGPRRARPCGFGLQLKSPLAPAAALWRARWTAVVRLEVTCCWLVRFASKCG